jgi:hypothetical protein
MTFGADIFGKFKVPKLSCEVCIAVVGGVLLMASAVGCFFALRVAAVFLTRAWRLAIARVVSAWWLIPLINWYFSSCSLLGEKERAVGLSVS